MELDSRYTVELTASLVREYLSRKGLKNTFSVFEEELPRTNLSINSRTTLIKALHLKHQAKQNKESSHPYSAILEVLISCLIPKSKSTEITGDKFNQSQLKCGKIDIAEQTIRGTDGQNCLISSTMDHKEQIHRSRNGKTNRTESGIETFDAAPVRQSVRMNVIKKEIAFQAQKEYETKPDEPKAILPRSEGTKTKGHADNQSMKSSSSNYLKNAGAMQVNRENRLVKKFNDLEVEDLEDFESEGVFGGCIGQSLPRSQNYQSNCVSMTLKQAVELRHLIFGRESTSFSHEWMKQDFTFHDVESKIYYGIIQHRGGPCGILAAIQAFVFKYLFFCTQEVNSVDLQPKRDEALIHAIGHILWQAGKKKKCSLVLPTARKKFIAAGKFKSDGIMEYLSVFEFSKYSDLLSGLRHNIAEIQNGKGGCIFVLYSIILSRGIQRVKSDMDDPQNHLIGAHGYCSQEMVNLILTGKASSNVFNDVIELDSGGSAEKSILKGIFDLSEIGFLSLFEHYNSCEVGTYLKYPIYPVWVVCSESHFSVLFGKDPKIVGNQDKKFDLFYYDGLAQQEDEIKLTIDPITPPSYCGLVPPLDECIRTKWKNVSISWNGYDPIL